MSDCHTQKSSSVPLPPMAALSALLLSACLFTGRTGLAGDSVLRYARALMEKHDTNGDGRLDRDEWSRMKEAPAASGESVTADDLAEKLAAYYQHMLEIRETKLAQGLNPIPQKIHLYCQRLVGKFDRDGDGQLQESEWQQMPGSPCWADSDRDTVVTLGELGELVTHYGQGRKIRLVPPPSVSSGPPPKLLHPRTSPDPSAEGNGQSAPAEDELPGPARDTATQPNGTEDLRRQRRFAARLPEGLPDWFDRRDANGDGQLTMREFAAAGTQSELAQFQQLDRNRDGVITAWEYLKVSKSSGERPLPR